MCTSAVMRYARRGGLKGVELCAHALPLLCLISLSPSQAAQLGPFSSQRQLLEAREGAIAARKERLEELQRREHAAGDTIAWAPALPLRVRGPSSARRMASLVDCCIVTLADVIADVDSLYGLPQCYVVRCAGVRRTNSEFVTANCFVFCPRSSLLTPNPLPPSRRRGWRRRWQIAAR